MKISHYFKFLNFFCNNSLVAFLIFMAQPVFSQNEQSKWYFGNMAGLDFMTVPPTVLTGSMNTTYGCASIADAAGNLLFYTDGGTVWNQQHQVMANGTGLLGLSSGPMGNLQPALIIKNPANNASYYIFTADGAGNNGLRYSMVDMNLAAGMGSITVKNTLVYAPTSHKLGAVRHCNGTDIWIVTHEKTGGSFKAYLLTAAGLNLTPVISTLGPVYYSNAWGGNIKFSPDGNRIATSTGAPIHSFELFDFDKTIGIVSNYMQLQTGPMTGPFGCEFSPDGSKFYGIRWNGPEVYQWDLCAGSAALVQASMYTVTEVPAAGKGMMLTAPNGKIYVGRWWQPALGVINNPNAAGATCNYVEAGQSLGTNSCTTGLPNFMMEFRKTQLSPFTASLSSCSSASFSMPATPNVTVTGCSSLGYSLTSVAWNFGDPASGAGNISNAASPTHNFSSPGNYSVRLVLYYSCGYANDTLRQTIPVVAPSLSIAGIFTICPGKSTTLTASGANTYSWSTSSQSPTLTIAPSVTTIYTLTGTSTLTGCSSSKTVKVNVSPCTGISELDESNNIFQLFPNPHHGQLTIKASVPAMLELYDLIGNRLLSMEIANGENHINLKRFDDGIYFAAIKYKEHVKVIRLIKAE